MKCKETHVLQSLLIISVAYNLLLTLSLVYLILYLAHGLATILNVLWWDLHVGKFTNQTDTDSARVNVGDCLLGSTNSTLNNRVAHRYKTPCNLAAILFGLPLAEKTVYFFKLLKYFFLIRQISYGVGVSQWTVSTSREKELGRRGKQAASIRNFEKLAICCPLCRDISWARLRLSSSCHSRFANSRRAGLLWKLKLFFYRLDEQFFWNSKLSNIAPFC